MRTLQLRPLPDPDWPPDPQLVADLYADRARTEPTWPELLAMAARDGALSIHYHPWRTNAVRDDILSYVVDGTRYGLVRPTDGSAARLPAEAREILAPGPLRSLIDRALGRGVVGRVRLEGAYGESDWCGVVWAGGGLTGVDFYRLGPVPAVQPPGDPAEPPAAPDRNGTS